jgi:hypothetical protein
MAAETTSPSRTRSSLTDAAPAIATSLRVSALQQAS